MDSSREASSGIVDIHDLVNQGLPSLHLRFLHTQTPKLVSAIKQGHTQKFLGHLYFQFIRTFPEQRLTLSTKGFLEKCKLLEEHIYLLSSAMLESVNDQILDKENVSWGEVLTYICGQRDREYIVTWDTMKGWLEEGRTKNQWIWN